MQAIQSTATARQVSGATVRAKAAVIVNPQETRVREIEVPAPAAGEVRIRVEGCGVCASNIPVWEGREWFQYPLEPGAPGHEAWGRIESVGADVRNVKRGDRVATLSPRAFAEYVVCRSHEVVSIPDTIDQALFPGEPLGCAMNIFKRSRIAEGETVAIVGIGFLGALLTQLISRTGARVVAVSRRSYALRVAGECGAEVSLDSTDRERVHREVMRLTREVGCDCVIEAAGKQESLDIATDLTSERGRLVIAGYHQDGLRQVNMQVWNWRGLDVINAHERDSQVYADGIREAIQAIESGRLDPKSLYTHQYSLSDLHRAFQMAVERPDGFMKAVVTL